MTIIYVLRYVFSIYKQCDSEIKQGGFTYFCQDCKGHFGPCQYL